MTGVKSPRMVNTALRFPQRTLDRADELVEHLNKNAAIQAIGHEVNRSDVMRMAIQRGLELMESEAKDKARTSSLLTITRVIPKGRRTMAEKMTVVTATTTEIGGSDFSKTSIKVFGRMDTLNTVWMWAAKRHNENIPRGDHLRDFVLTVTVRREDI